MESGYARLVKNQKKKISLFNSIYYMEIELEKIGINRNENIVSISSLNPIVAFTGEKIYDVCKKMSNNLHRSLPVVDKKLNLKGIVTITDILNLFLGGWDMNLPIENIMSREIVSCEENEKIEYVLKKMKISKRGRLPIVSNNKIVGIISETDFILASKSFDVFNDTEIEEVMIKKPLFIPISFSIKEVIRTMVYGKYRRLPIVENGKLVGYVTSTLLFKNLIDNSFSNSFINKSISEIMTKDPIVVEKKEKLNNVLQKMKERKISSMLIVDENNKLEGIFTERDFINLLV
jgi:CBS domain-containing protein